MECIVRHTIATVYCCKSFFTFPKHSAQYNIEHDKSNHYSDNALLNVINVFISKGRAGQLDVLYVA